jgi:S-adenosylmethionine:tRNA ribosyltransferase-isomerase
MNPGLLAIEDFDYSLPDNHIAYHPLPQRDQSKLLVYKDQKIQDAAFGDLLQYIDPTSTLVFNDTRVIPARILFQKPSGSAIEIFCLEPAYHQDIQTAMAQKSGCTWNAVVGGLAKWKQGSLQKKIIASHGDETVLEARILQRETNSVVVEFSWSARDLCFSEVLEAAGQVPLPPYLHREARAEDKQRYQTVYAAVEGSVAAPTAGLHFTQDLLHRLDLSGVSRLPVTLHVGAGTFRPVKSETLQNHTMHAEWFSVPRTTIDHMAKDQHRSPVIAVGTTSFRTLESLYWLGIYLVQHPDTQYLPMIDQWRPYHQDRATPSLNIALAALLEYLDRHQMDTLIGQTQLLVAPGYKPRVVKGLITNFHQPRSTLLVLIAALVGADWKKIYGHALAQDYRFLSYGDASLLYW